MTNNVAIIGYSGHSLVVVDTLQQAGYVICGYIEKEVLKENPLQLNYLGYEMDSDFIVKVNGILLFPAIGDNSIRKKIINFLIKNELEMARAISPKSYVSPYSSIQNGTLVCHGACINPLAFIGKGVIINTGAIIEHECVIDDFAHIAPGAVLAGNVHVGENSFVGANTVVKQGIRIGKNVIVGAGSVVLKDIPDNEIWFGNPSRRMKR
jgi:sugar O-acyltransferase (sialic acid O-acetyltransferase NeuD family)